MRSFSFALLVLLGLPSSHATASDAEVLRKFGMLGRIAVDCNAPASKENRHRIYTVSQPRVSSRAP